MRKQKPLTPQQVRFCHEYLVDSCARQAAIRAGYKPECAAMKGHRLLKAPALRAYIAELQAELSVKYKANAGCILYELGLVAFSDVADYLSFGNEVKDLKSISEPARRAIASITVSHSYNKSHADIQLKLHDKIGAIKLLGRYFGLFNQPAPTGAPADTKKSWGTALGGNKQKLLKIRKLIKNVA